MMFLIILNFYECNLYGDHYWIYLKNNQDAIKLYKKGIHKNWWDIEYFEDYFYTLKEIRYKKIKKIYGSR